jgi:hypothetical protein
MFSITCRTCAAKLKVKNTAAIGQRLACPKCGEMVEVLPPPGWTAPPDSEVAESASVDQSFAAGDFEDIDQLIGGKSPVASSSSAAKAKPPTSASPQQTKGPVAKSQPANGGGKPSREAEKNPSVKPVRERPPGELPATTAVPISVPEKPLLQPRSDKFDLTQPREYLPDPNLPPPDWTKSGSSKARTILVSSLLLVGFLGVIAAIVALLNRSDTDKSNKQVAQAKPAVPVAELPAKQAPPKESATPEPADASREETKQAAPSANSQKDVQSSDSGDAKKGEEEKPSETPKSEQPNKTSDAESSDKQPEMRSEEEKPQEKPATGASDPLPSREERPVSPLAPESSPVSNLPGESTGVKPDAGSPPTPNGPTTLTDRLGKLSQLLSGPGTSLTELGDLAQSERTDRMVGLPRYLISQATPESPIGDPWSVPVAEVVYKEVPLHLFISEFSLLTGVPMSIDGLALAQRGIPIDTPISVELENTSTGEILGTVLQKLKLERVNLSGVEVILPAGSQVTGDYRFPLPKIKDPSPEKFQAMSDSLMKLVDPVSWSLDTGKRKLSAEGEELVVANTSTAAAQIGEFLGKLEAATQFLANPADADAAERLRSRAVRSQVGLQKALQLEPTLDLPLEEFLQRVYQQSGVAISVDWAALSAAGWSNRSTVPGDFQAATVEQLLKELARSLSATWIAIDERTFQLTSYQEATRRGMLEIYPLQGLAIEPQPLMDILNQTLSGQLRENPAVQFLYVPEINALVVSAPQPLQRQFEAIVNRLRQPKK